MDEKKKEDVKVEQEAKPETPKEKPVDKKSDKITDKFIERKLAVINTMSNQAKARRAAERVLANKRKAVN